MILGGVMYRLWILDMFWNGWHLPFKDLDLWWLLSPRPSINSSIVTVAGQQGEVVHHPAGFSLWKALTWREHVPTRFFFREIPGKQDISKNCWTPNLYWWIRSATLQPANKVTTFALILWQVALKFWRGGGLLWRNTKLGEEKFVFR